MKRCCSAPGCLDHPLHTPELPHHGQAAVNAHSSNDVEVAALAREFVKLSQAYVPPQGESDYKVIAPDLSYECKVEVTL